MVIDLKNTCTIESIIEIIKIFSQPGIRISATTNLVEVKAIDSVNILQIISELESRFNLSLGAMGITFDNFKSPETLFQAVQELIKEQTK